jgi:hypothetical protein
MDVASKVASVGNDTVMIAETVDSKTVAAVAAPTSKPTSAAQNINSSKQAAAAAAQIRVTAGGDNSEKTQEELAHLLRLLIAKFCDKYIVKKLQKANSQQQQQQRVKLNSESSSNNSKTDSEETVLSASHLEEKKADQVVVLEELNTKVNDTVVSGGDLEPVVECDKSIDKEKDLAAAAASIAAYSPPATNSSNSSDISIDVNNNNSNDSSTHAKQQSSACSTLSSSSSSSDEVVLATEDSPQQPKEPQQTSPDVTSSEADTKTETSNFENKDSEIGKESSTLVEMKPEAAVVEEAAVADELTVNQDEVDEMIEDIFDDLNVDYDYLNASRVAGVNTAPSAQNSRKRRIVNMNAASRSSSTLIGVDKLEIFGSIHVRASNVRLLSCLIDQQLQLSMSEIGEDSSSFSSASSHVSANPRDQPIVNGPTSALPANILLQKRLHMLSRMESRRERAMGRRGAFYDDHDELADFYMLDEDESSYMRRHRQHGRRRHRHGHHKRHSNQHSRNCYKKHYCSSKSNANRGMKRGQQSQQPQYGLSAAAGVTGSPVLPPAILPSGVGSICRDICCMPPMNKSINVASTLLPVANTNTNKLTEAANKLYGLDDEEEDYDDDLNENEEDYDDTEEFDDGVVVVNGGDKSVVASSAVGAVTNGVETSAVGSESMNLSSGGASAAAATPTDLMMLYPGMKKFKAYHHYCNDKKAKEQQQQETSSSSNKKVCL